MRLALSSLVAVVCVWSAAAALARAATSEQNILMVPAVTAQLPAGSTELYTRLSARIPARLRPWIAKAALQLSLGQTNVDNGRGPYDHAISNMGLNDGDIEQVAFIVLFEATNDLDKDLKSLAATIHARQKLRDQSAWANAQATNNAASPTPSTDVAISRGAPSGSTSQLDSINEQNEISALRMQSMLERRAKLFSALSGAMSRLTLTTDRLVPNIK